jgi:peptide/nickel transport system substrate-binding protein
MGQRRPDVWGYRLGRRRFVRGAAVAGAVTGVVTLGGCATTSTVTVPTSAPAGAPAAPPTSAPAAPAVATAAPTAVAKYGGQVKYNVGSDTPHLDPHQTNSTGLLAWGPGMAWGQLMLFKWSATEPMPNFTPAPDLATSWEQAAADTWVLKLRQGVKYHNIAPVSGREFVANDVVQSLNRQVAEKINGAILDDMAKVEEVDKYTVKMTLKRENPDFIQGLAFQFTKVVPHESWELKGDLKAGPIIGTGPFIAGPWVQNQEFTFTRNPDYYDKGLPYLDKVVLARIVDGATLVAAFRSKQTDIISVGLQPTDIELLKKNHPDAKTSTQFGFTKLELGLKADRPPFNDIRLRQAFQKAVNRDEVINTIYPGIGAYDPALNGLAPDQILTQAEIKELTKLDIAGAKKLMADAGFPNGLDLEMLVNNTLGGIVPNAAELVAAQVAQAGFRVKLSVLDAQAFLTRVTAPGPAGDWVSYMTATQPPRPTHIELIAKFKTGGVENKANTNDKVMDDLIDQQAKQGKDPAARTKTLKDIQKRIIELAAYQQIAQQQTVFFWWPHVKDFNPNGNTNDGVNTYQRAIWVDK